MDHRASWGTAASATLHCLTGCAIGEVLGMVIGTAAGLHNAATIVLSVALAFLFGYALTIRGVLRAGVGLRAALAVALAADTVSIAIMELLDNAVMLAVPGALEAGISQAQVNAMLEFETGPFTDAEKAVLAYAREVSLTNAAGHMSPELFARLRQHFSQADILELGVTMAVISGMAKLSFVLDLVEKEDYCPFAGTAAA